jgi:threonine dehydratase
MNHITFEHVKQARERIAKVAHHTPLEYSRSLSAALRREIFLKLECFQLTGSFKLRGAMAKLTALDEEEKARGILTVSAGNHGLAVAYGASALDINATIVVPTTASRAKVEAISRYPVSLIERGANYDEAERAAREMERETGKTFVSPYNDMEVIAGQGTIALEILEDAPQVDAIIIPIGGGGLIAGIALAAKTINPQIKIYGAEPKTTPTMLAALKAGGIIEIKEDETIADGLAGNIEPGSITFPVVQQFVDEVITVGEDEIKTALTRFAHDDHVMIEGAAAVSLAALASKRIEGEKIVAVVSGRNISLDRFTAIVSSQI